MQKMQIIILAAGLGKRMASGDIPKALVPLRGKPMITYLVQSIIDSGVTDKPVVVVGKKAEMVQEALGDSVQYALQKEQLGTGHAVSCARPAVEGNAENVMVLYCDHPLVSSTTIQQIADTHLRGGCVLTLATTTVSDFSDWRAAFYDYGRIVRSSNGEIQEIIEKKDATEEQLQITEVNPSYFCYDALWLWSHLDKVRNNNAQREYYLTDLVGFAFAEQQRINTISIEPKEAMGVNTIEQLQTLSDLQ